MAADPDELVSVSLPRRALFEAYISLRMEGAGLRVKAANDPAERATYDAVRSQVNEAAVHIGRALGIELKPGASL